MYTGYQWKYSASKRQALVNYICLWPQQKVIKFYRHIIQQPHGRPLNICETFLSSYPTLHVTNCLYAIFLPSICLLFIQIRYFNKLYVLYLLYSRYFCLHKISMQYPMFKEINFLLHTSTCPYNKKYPWTLWIPSIHENKSYKKQ